MLPGKEETRKKKKKKAQTKGKQQAALEESFFYWGVIMKFILGLWIQNQFLYYQSFATQKPVLNFSPTTAWSAWETSALFEATNYSRILNPIVLPTIFLS